MESLKRLGQGKGIRPRQRITEKYEAANRECARIIRTDPARSGGLPVIWARAVLKGREAEQRAGRLVV